MKEIFATIGWALAVCAVLFLVVFVGSYYLTTITLDVRRKLKEFRAGRKS
jgi:hypothetical protein